MKILVIGGAGYIGSISVELLLNQGYVVVVIDNLQEGNRLAVLEPAIFYEGNYGNRKLLRQIFADHSIDAVVHFAADASVPISMKDPSPFFINNVANGIALLDVMREFDCDRIVFSSTAAIFGEPQYTPIDELHPQVPINPYGESKLMFERILDWYHRVYGLKYIAFRYFNASGASGNLGEAHKNEAHLIPLVLQVALGQREHIKVYGNDYQTKDGTCIRDYIHVLDIADAHILALSHLDRVGSAFYNLGNGGGFSVLEVIELARQITGHPIPIVMSDRRLGDPAVLIASSECIQTEFGWKPQFPSLESIIQTAWKWHSMHPNGYEN